MTASLPQIPFIDIRGRSPVELLAEFPDRAKSLVKATTATFGLASKIGATIAFPYLDRASKRWLEATSNPYRDEIGAFETLLCVRGVYALNICFEWGCTACVFKTEDGIVLRRVLDWGFPALGKHLIVAHQRGRAGDFYNVTWPGMSGMYHGLAPGRFAAAINQAPMRRHGGAFVFDWAKNRVAVKRDGGMPAAHLLRYVFETAPDYAAALQLLCETPIAVSAIFTLVGVDDGVVIERTENDFALREINGDRVCATNHFETRLIETAHRWQPRSHDSPERLATARALSHDKLASDFSWFVPPIANPTSRVLFSANPRSGALAVMGVEGAEPATRPFELSASAVY